MLKRLRAWVRLRRVRWCRHRYSDGADAWHQFVTSLMWPGGVGVERCDVCKGCRLMQDAGGGFYVLSKEFVDNGMLRGIQPYIITGFEVIDLDEQMRRLQRREDDFSRFLGAGGYDGSLRRP